MMVQVRYLRRVYGGTVKCFCKGRYNAWKVLAVYRTKPHYFSLSH